MSKDTLDKSSRRSHPLIGGIKIVGICRQWHHSMANAAFFCSPIHGAPILRDLFLISLDPAKDRESASRFRILPIPPDDSSFKYPGTAACSSDGVAASIFHDNDMHFFGSRNLHVSVYGHAPARSARNLSRPRKS